MTPADFRAARRQLGLSARDMARALGLGSGRTVRRYESGQCPVPGPVAKLLEFWTHPKCLPSARPVPSRRAGAKTGAGPPPEGP